jgi:AraC-like DNA-binding protein/mannose-6-phosphate isomerase-like protein (cupin superfamily)
MYVHTAAPTSRAWRQHLRLDHATSGDRAHLHGRRQGEHRHDVYHVVLVTSGRGTFLLMGEEVPVQAPWLFLVSPGQTHSFQAGLGDTTVYSEVTFSGADAQGRVLRLAWPDLLRERFGCPCPVPVHGPLEPPVGAALGAIIDEVVACGHGGGALVASILDGLLSHLLFVIFRELVAHPEGSGGDALERARAMILAQVAEAPRLGAIARASGISAKHLTRAFKQRYGLAPTAFRRRAAMEQAATLVRSSRLPLAEIANRLGFDDLPYFTRVFRRIHGEPPGHFRRRHLSGAGDGL